MTNLLVDAVVNRLVPRIMRQDYEEVYEPCGARNDMIYHCFRPATPGIFESVEVKMHHVDGIVYVDWGDKQIQITPHGNDEFSMFFFAGLRHDFLAEEFASIDAVMDRAMRFV